MAAVCPHHGLEVFQGSLGGPGEEGTPPSVPELRHWYNEVFLPRMREHLTPRAEAPGEPDQDATAKKKGSKVWACGCSGGHSMGRCVHAGPRCSTVGAGNGSVFCGMPRRRACRCAPFRPWMSTRVRPAAASA